MLINKRYVQILDSTSLEFKTDRQKQRKVCLCLDFTLRPGAELPHSQQQKWMFVFDQKWKVSSHSGVINFQNVHSCILLLFYSKDLRPNHNGASLVIGTWIHP